MRSVIGVLIDKILYNPLLYLILIENIILKTSKHGNTTHSSKFNVSSQINIASEVFTND